MPPLRTSVLVGSALVAFAGNSILCRAALGAGHADPATFTLVRIACGAAVLVALTRSRRTAPPARERGAAARALSLLAYAALFSWAYLRVPAGTGALVLFAFVQLTMIAGAIRLGAGPRGLQWAGLLLAMGGLAALTLPGSGAADPAGLLLMAASGVAWGVYSLLGRRATAPLATTATSFVGALPLAILVAGASVALSGARLAADGTGLALAATSGAVTSGLGYAAWYAVLPALGPTRAAVVQVAVPVLTAFAGVVFLREAPGVRLVAASAAILAGIALATVTRPAPGPRGDAPQG